MKAMVLTFLLAACLVLMATMYLSHIPDNDPQVSPAPSIPGNATNSFRAGEASQKNRTSVPDTPENLVKGGAVPRTYRETVDMGLEYLAKSQFEDGHWEGDGGQHPVAMTGLAGLALLMERKVGREGKYLANIRQAADWLMAKSLVRQDGLIFSGHPSEVGRYMEGHGLATLFLAGVSRDENATRNAGKSSGMPSTGRSSLSRAPRRPKEAGTTHPRWKGTISPRFQRP